MSVPATTVRMDEKTDRRFRELCDSTRLSVNDALILCVEGMCDLIGALPGAEELPLVVKLARAARQPVKLSVSASDTSLPILATVAERIRWARHKRRLKLAALSHDTGLGTSAISCFEHGHRPARACHLEPLARALNVPLPWLATGQLEAASQAA